jgi:hypothetical protein
MKPFLKPIQSEIYSTGKFCWYWSITLRPPREGALDLEQSGFCFTYRGAERKVAKYIKEFELANQTYKSKDL